MRNMYNFIIIIQICSNYKYFDSLFSDLINVENDNDFQNILDRYNLDKPVSMEHEWSIFEKLPGDEIFISS